MLIPLLAIAATSACSASAQTPQEHGKQVYATCIQCHKADGSGSELATAPNIAGLQAWYVTTEIKDFQNGTRGNPYDIEALKMRPMAMLLQSTADIQAVAAYIQSLPPVQRPPTLGGDINHGKAIFEQTCITCHGANAQGNQAIGAPSLAGRADWYVVKELEKFRAGIRGSDPRDTTGATMHGVAMSLTDVQAIRDVAAYVASLK